MSLSTRVPSVSKACFTFGSTPGMPVLAPVMNGTRHPAFGVSSVSFLAPEHLKCPYAHLPVCDSPVRVDGKLVLKARQFPGVDSSNWTSCFKPESLKRLREPGLGKFTVMFNPPIPARDSYDSEDIPHTVATVVEDAVLLLTPPKRQQTSPSEPSSSQSSTS